MARRTSLISLQQISEINLTPLMDLTFILLITFIITFPLLEQGIPVNLPTGKAEELDPEATRTITLDREGVLYLDDLRVSAEELAREMQIVRRTAPNMTVLVRADEAVRYGLVADILRILHDARISRMALVTQPQE